jgi:hypothetical protein
VRDSRSFRFLLNITRAALMIFDVVGHLGVTVFVWMKRGLRVIVRFILYRVI